MGIYIIMKISFSAQVEINDAAWGLFFNIFKW